jgi:hypothetical protein
MRPNFIAMTRSQLREYTLTHTDDQEALYALIDKCHIENPSPKTLSLDRLEDEITQILREKGFRTESS